MAGRAGAVARSGTPGDSGWQQIQGGSNPERPHVADGRRGRVREEHMRHSGEHLFGAAEGVVGAAVPDDGHGHPAYCPGRDRPPEADPDTAQAGGDPSRLVPGRHDHDDINQPTGPGHDVVPICWADCSWAFSTTLRMKCSSR